MDTVARTISRRPLGGGKYEVTERRRTHAGAVMRLAMPAMQQRFLPRVTVQRYVGGRWRQVPAWKCQTVAPQAQGRPKCCRAAVPVLPGVRAGAGGRQCVGPSVVGLPLAVCAAALPLRCVLAVGFGRQLRRPRGTVLLRRPCRCRPRSRRRRSAAAVDAAAGQPSPVWIHGGPARMSGNKTPDAPAGRRAAPVSKGAICTFCPSGFGRVSGCVKCSLAVPAPACRIGHALPPRSSASACLACAAGCRHTPAPPPRPARLRSRATPLHTAAHCAGP